ncbi:HMG box-containing protein C19G7.04 like [Verticillium longisporum]|nr:HMG box-containing protein C19G7.04 like [Verticillium longisporum]
MKKGFEQSRQHLAEVFLAELDDAILQGQLRKLTNSTGGIKIVWSKKLNTTAGRANWRKEKLLDRQAGIEGSVDMSRHYASIELAEKVIDNEDRLFNVIAHEFCHLANFMISGITGNPHGKEFKTWTARVSKTFTDRGILVTTKHSYDIDFKSGRVEPELERPWTPRSISWIRPRETRLVGLTAQSDQCDALHHDNL